MRNEAVPTGSISRGIIPPINNSLNAVGFLERLFLTWPVCNEQGKRNGDGEERRGGTWPEKSSLKPDSGLMGRAVIPPANASDQLEAFILPDVSLMAAELRRETRVCETQLDVNLVSRCRGSLPFSGTSRLGETGSSPPFYARTTVLEFRAESPRPAPRYHRPVAKIPS